MHGFLPLLAITDEIEKEVDATLFFVLAGTCALTTSVRSFSQQESDEQNTNLTERQANVDDTFVEFV